MQALATSMSARRFGGRVYPLLANPPPLAGKAGWPAIVQYCLLSVLGTSSLRQLRLAGPRFVIIDKPMDRLVIFNTHSMSMTAKVKFVLNPVAGAKCFVRFNPAARHFIARRANARDSKVINVAQLNCIYNALDYALTDKPRQGICPPDLRASDNHIPPFFHTV